jgi:CHASE1-domain containing sensor protein
MALWAIAALVLVPFRDAYGDWLRICIAGVLVGIPGLAMMLVHDANRRRRRASQ